MTRLRESRQLLHFACSTVLLLGGGAAWLLAGEGSTQPSVVAGF